MCVSLHTDAPVKQAFQNTCSSWYQLTAVLVPLARIWPSIPVADRPMVSERVPLMLCNALNQPD